MKKLNNKVIVITGSSMGIGKKMAVAMAEKGAKIVLNGRNEKRLNQTCEILQAQGYKIHAVPGDVSVVADCKFLMEETIRAFGQIDVLINNAGISTEGTVEELHPEIFRKIMEVNYLGSVYPTQAAIPYLKKTKGSIVFISSAAGIRGIPNYGVYSSSKMALTALAESLKIETQKAGIHIGIAYVGFTENDPDKTIYNTKGEIVPQPKRDFIKAEPPEKVAQRIIMMIQKRTFKSVFTPLGKLNAFMNRFFPGVVNLILSNNFWKQKTLESNHQKPLNHKFSKTHKQTNVPTHEYTSK